MKGVGFILGELVIAALLVALLFLALLFQPTWMWVAVGVVMLGAFSGIIAWAKTNPGRARLLVLICPLSYVVYLLALGLSAPNPGLFLTVAAYYAGGVILLGAHQLLNAKAR